MSSVRIGGISARKPAVWERYFARKLGVIKLKTRIGNADIDFAEI